MKTNKPLTIYTATFYYKQWELGLFKTARGLLYLSNSPYDEEEVTRCRTYLEKHYPTARFEHEPAQFASEFCELKDYFAGELKNFTLSIDQDTLHATPFQRQVWHVMSQIPYGQTATYQELAHMLDYGANYARAVGSAVGANPLLILYPCHRVVRTDGTHTGYRGGLPMKRALFDLEQQRHVPPANHVP